MLISSVAYTLVSVILGRLLFSRIYFFRLFISCFKAYMKVYLFGASLLLNNSKYIDSIYFNPSSFFSIFSNNILSFLSWSSILFTSFTKNTISFFCYVVNFLIISSGILISFSFSTMNTLHNSSIWGEWFLKIFSIH